MRSIRPQCMTLSRLRIVAMRCCVFVLCRHGGDSIGQPAAWQPPRAQDVKAQAFAWVEAKKVDAGHARQSRGDLVGPACDRRRRTNCWCGWRGRSPCWTPTPRSCWRCVPSPAAGWSFPRKAGSATAARRRCLPPICGCCMPGGWCTSRCSTRLRSSFRDWRRPTWSLPPRCCFTRAWSIMRY